MWTVNKDRKKNASTGVFTWARIFDHWPAIEADFRDEYGINLADWSGTWRAFATLIVGLITKPPRTDVAPNGAVLLAHTTRLGNALEPARVIGGNKDKD